MSISACTSVNITCTMQIQATQSWLSSPGSYADYAVAMAKKDPTLDFPDSKNRRCPLSSRRACATVLAMNGDQTITRRAYSSAQNLKAAISDCAAEGRIIVLEGLDRDFIDVLGTRFHIHPRFFVDHERTRLWSYHHDQSSKCTRLTPELASLKDIEQAFELSFYELRHFLEIPAGYQLSCALTGRHIGVHKMLGDIQPVITLRRRVSYWSDVDQVRSQRSWNVLIVCDPPLEHVQIGSGENVTFARIESEPYQGGYIDFTSRDDIPGAPGRASMLEDFCSYVNRLHGVSGNTFSPNLAKIVVRKMVASHYMLFVEYLRAHICQLEWFLSRRDSLDVFDQSWVELQWSNLQSLNRRLSEYSQDVDSIVLGLEVATPTPTTPHKSLYDSMKDFRAISNNLERLQRRSGRLLDSMTGLASIIGNKQSIKESKRSLREAKSVKTLTILGVIFAPLALCCGLFSMSDSFLPGHGHFWVFFAVAVPLIAMVVLLFYIIDFGYDDEGIWSIRLLKVRTSFWRRKMGTYRI